VAVRLSLKANAQIHGLRLRGACCWLHFCNRRTNYYVSYLLSQYKLYLICDCR
jgi:hypothetical protein